MSFTVVGDMIWGAVPPSPPDDPSMPHSWVARMWRDKNSGKVSFACRCDECGTDIEASYSPSSHGGLYAWAVMIRRWPVPGNCELALARRVMEE